MVHRALSVGPTLGRGRDYSAEVGPASDDLLCCLVSARVCMHDDLVFK